MTKTWKRFVKRVDEEGKEYVERVQIDDVYTMLEEIRDTLNEILNLLKGGKP